MRRFGRKTILSGVLMALLAVAAAWAYGRCRAADADLRRAREDLAACWQLAAGIERFRQRPNQAGAEELRDSALAGQIEQAAQQAGMAPAAVARIWPEPARRVGETVYKEKTTQVVLKNVTMRQAVTFLHSLTTGRTTGLWAKSLRLTAPREQGLQDRWVVEAVVAYLIYAPAARTAEPVEEAGS